MKTLYETFRNPSDTDIYSDCPPESYPLPAQRRLAHGTDLVYGDIPRRVSANYALASVVGVAMMTPMTTSAPYPEEMRKDFGDEKQAWFHYPETEDTLYVGSWRIGEHTWLSNRERALLDTAHIGNHNRVPEWILLAMSCKEFDAKKLIEIAEEADLLGGLRKIASISVLLGWYKKIRRTPAWTRELRKYAKSLPSEETVYICESGLKFGLTDGWYDKDFDVIWNVSREETFNEMLVF